MHRPDLRAVQQRELQLHRPPLRGQRQHLRRQEIFPRHPGPHQPQLRQQPRHRGDLREDGERHLGLQGEEHLRPFLHLQVDARALRAQEDRPPRLRFHADPRPRQPAEPARRGPGQQGLVASGRVVGGTPSRAPHRQGIHPGQPDDGHLFRAALPPHRHNRRVAGFRVLPHDADQPHGQSAGPRQEQVRHRPGHQHDALQHA